MPQSLAQIWIHLTFSTKDRRPYLRNEIFRTSMFKMLSHETKQIGCVNAAVGGHFDHVHVLFGMSRTITISKTVEHIKIETSKWAKKTEEGSSNFTWQKGYAAFSVSHSNIDTVENYIRNQMEHHKRMTFQEEYRLMCQRHNIEIDERYAWD